MLSSKQNGDFLYTRKSASWQTENTQVLPNLQHTRQMSKKKTDKKDKLVDQMVEDLIEEDEEENVDGFFNIQDSQLNKFLNAKSSGGGKKVKGKGSIQKMRYDEFTEIVKGEQLWKQMSKVMADLKTFYIQQLTIRSATSLDELEIELEGDLYPLNELASISKKDPKRLIIDASAFPQATKNILMAIKNSGMNLNPQQDGLTIYVPIPKVTTQHREQLCDGAKKKLTEAKTNLKKIQNTHSRQVGEDELADKITKDDAKAAVETIRLITEHFQAEGEVLLAVKTKELLGK